MSVRRMRPDDLPTLASPEQQAELRLGRVPAVRKSANPLPVLFFARLCDKQGIARPEKELVFHPTRKWRFDVAWPQHKVALEVHGGSWVAGGGGHNRGTGAMGDWTKINEAQLLGWLVIQVPRSLGGAESWLSLDTVDLCARAIARQKARRTDG